MTLEKLLNLPGPYFLHLSSERVKEMASHWSKAGGTLPAGCSQRGPFRLPVLGVPMDPGLHFQPTDSENGFYHFTCVEWIPMSSAWDNLLAGPLVCSLSLPPCWWTGPFRSKLPREEGTRPGGSSAEGAFLLCVIGSKSLLPISAHTPPFLPLSYILLCCCQSHLFKTQSGHCKIHTLHHHHHSAILQGPPSVLGRTQLKCMGLDMVGALAALPRLKPSPNRTGLSGYHAPSCKKACAHTVPSAWDTLRSPFPHFSSCLSFGSQLKGQSTQGGLL